MKKILSVVLFDNGGTDLFKFARLKLYLRFLKNITPKNDFLHIIDLRKYYTGKIINKFTKPKDKKIKYYRPKNLLDFYLYSKNKKIYAIGPINCEFRTLIIFIILKMLKINLVYINPYGFYLNLSSNSQKIISFKYKIKILKNIFFRALSVVGIIPRISYCFESSLDTINNIKKRFSYKFDKISFFKISYFKKIYHINSFYHNELLINNYQISNKNIVLIDSGLHHPDKKAYFSYDENYSYYENLFIFLQKLKKKYSKKIIYCVHPKSYYPNHIKKYIKTNFILSKKADKDIYSSFFILFTGGSSMINKALILKKNFIYLASDQNHYSNLLINSLSKIFPIKKFYFERCNIQQFEKKLKKKIIYKNFIKKNLVFNKKLTSSMQINNVLFK